MTNDEIRANIDNIYLQIKELEEKLKLIRADCKHEKKKKGMTINFTIMEDCLICETCDESFPMPDSYYKISRTKRGKRGKKSLIVKKLKVNRTCQSKAGTYIY